MDAEAKRDFDALSRNHEQLSRVIAFAAAIYGDETKTRNFMTRPHPMMQGRTPVDVALENKAGADCVINLLGRGAYGGGA